MLRRFTQENQEEKGNFFLVKRKVSGECQQMKNLFHVSTFSCHFFLLTFSHSSAPKKNDEVEVGGRDGRESE
jgi:hypothetical protein